MASIKLSKVLVFEWDEANIGHIARHDVVPKEAEEVFLIRRMYKMKIWSIQHLRRGF